MEIGGNWAVRRQESEYEQRNHQMATSSVSLESRQSSDCLAALSARTDMQLRNRQQQVW